MNALLLDIEGTTTAISFVVDVLFPYARDHLVEFLTSQQEVPAVREVILAVLADASPAERALGDLAGAIAVAQRQMAGDVKATGLKQLQGLLWSDGYHSGAIKAHVFPDVPVALRAWRAAGREVAIYSSGSQLAQQLLFRYSCAGDLTTLLHGYYDTTSGPKREPQSYRTIAQAWGRPAASITFCTDQPAEAEAALSAGLTAVLVMRPGNAALPPLQRSPVHGDLLAV